MLHSHDYEESLTFLTGRVQVTVEGEQSDVEAVTTLFIPPGIEHSVRNDGKEPARLIAVHATSEPKVIYPNGLPEPVKWS